MSAKTYKRFNDSEDSMAVFQDCLTTFNESPVNPNKCRKLLSKLYRLIINSVSNEPIFKPQEATSLFFSISKLFQHQDNDSLRQMVYLVIKELSSMSDDILMATASIMKDIQSQDSIIKPNAIRSLVRVLDSSTALTAERLLKSSIISSNNDISSAALVSAYHLLEISESTSKRLINETVESIDAKKRNGKLPVKLPASDLNSEEFEKLQYHSAISTHMSQYHSLALASSLKKNDEMGLLKLIKQCDPTTVDNPFARMEILRLCHRLVLKNSSKIDIILPYLEWSLNGSSTNNFIVLEGCKIIFNLKLKNMYPSAIDRLSYLINDRAISSKFAAVRLVSDYCHLLTPELANSIAADIEVLVNNENKSVSSYAISTLLKIGNSDNIESLVNGLKGSGMSDDFKVILIDSLAGLINRFPKVIVDFLLDGLKSHDGSNLLKNKIVDCLSVLFENDSINKTLDETFKINILESLCDFIEDCEYTDVLARVIYLLGEYGSKISIDSSVFVRHIYNRINLENSIIRAAAVTALAKFPNITEPLLRNIAKNDIDDEVRDRAVICVSTFEHPSSTSIPSVDPNNLIHSDRYLKILELRMNKYSEKNDFTNFDIPAEYEIDIKEIEADKDFKNKQEGSSLDDMSNDTDESSQNADDGSSNPADSILEAKIRHKYTELSESVLNEVTKSKKLTDSTSEFLISCQKFIFDLNDTKEEILAFKIENTMDFPVQNIKILNDDNIIENIEPQEKVELLVRAENVALESDKYWSLSFEVDDFEEVFEFNAL
ncbi:unnamed protein product [Hanseniaspora opuntiae]